MNKAIQPKAQYVAVTCSNCKTTYNVLSTRSNIKVELCSHCHPFYTGDQKIIDTANKVKDFERRKSTAQAINAKPKNEKTRKNSKVSEVRADRPLTLRDMLKQVQG